MTISKKMQNKAMRAITDYYAKYPTNHFIGEGFLVFKKVCKPQEEKHLLDVLCACNLITYELEGDICAIRLTPNGKKYFEDNQNATKEYLKDKWIDFLALIVAIIALIIAIDAHIKLPPG